jgi:hypothetical protein
MNAEPSDETARSNGLSSEPRADVARLHARRREARRRRRLARVDVGLGLVGALVLVLATPGLAITGLVALIVLALCGLTFALDRRGRPSRRRKSRESRRPDGTRATPR